MTEPATLFAAFMLGILGSAHCIGMCGGISSALSLSVQSKNPWPLLLSFHAGRITSYGVAGGLLGALGWYLGGLSVEVKMSIRYLAAVMLVLMGLYMGGWWRSLQRLERGGFALWSRLKPVGASLLPVQHLWQGLLLGGLWGWIPCGLVYSTLVWSASQSHPAHSAVLMVAFGVGTTPSVLLLGAFSRRLTGIVQAKLTRHIAGIAMIAFGLWSIPGDHQRWVMHELAQWY